MHALGHCDGSRPWLGPRNTETLRRDRTAADPHGQQRLLPADDERHLAARPRRGRRQGGRSGLGAYLEYVESLDDLPNEREAKAAGEAPLEGFTDEEVLAEIAGPRRRGGRLRGRQDRQAGGVGDADAPARRRSARTRPTATSIARSLPQPHWDTTLDEPASSGSCWCIGSARSSPRSASRASRPRHPTSRASWRWACDGRPWRESVTWLPAVENRGEGIFLQFKTEAIDAWHGRKPAVKRRAASSSEAGFECWKAGARKSSRAVLRAAVHHAALALAPADHGGLAGVRLSGQLDPRAHLRRRPSATASCSTRAPPTPRARWAGWSRPAGGSRVISKAAGAGRAVLERPGLRPAHARRTARAPVPARGRLPRLPADRRDVVRAAQRFPRPGPGGLHGGRHRCRVLRVGRRMTSSLCLLNSEDLLQLAVALRSGRIVAAVHVTRLAALPRRRPC